MGSFLIFILPRLFEISESVISIWGRLLKVEISYGSSHVSEGLISVLASLHTSELRRRYTGID